MKPEANSAKTPKVKVLNKPLHTRTDDDSQAKQLEPSEATCPIVRETL